MAANVDINVKVDPGKPAEPEPTGPPPSPVPGGDPVQGPGAHRGTVA